MTLTTAAQGARDNAFAVTAAAAQVVQFVPFDGFDQGELERTLRVEERRTLTGRLVTNPTYCDLALAFRHRVHDRVPSGNFHSVVASTASEAAGAASARPRSSR